LPVLPPMVPFPAGASGSKYRFPPLPSYRWNDPAGGSSLTDESLQLTVQQVGRDGTRSLEHLPKELGADHDIEPCPSEGSGSNRPHYITAPTSPTSYPPNPSPRAFRCRAAS